MYIKYQTACFACKKLLIISIIDKKYSRKCIEHKIFVFLLHYLYNQFLYFRLIRDYYLSPRYSGIGRIEFRENMPARQGTQLSQYKKKVSVHTHACVPWVFSSEKLHHLWLLGRSGDGGEIPSLQANPRFQAHNGAIISALDTYAQIEFIYVLGKRGLSPALLLLFDTLFYVVFKKMLYTIIRVKGFSILLAQ